MIETLFARNPSLLIPIVALTGAAIVFTVWIVSHYWHAVRRQEAETALKQDMLNRGFAAAEIERVLVSSSAKPEATPERQVVSDNEYYLVEKMLDDGHSIEDVERLIRAFKGNKDSSGIRLPERMDA